MITRRLTLLPLLAGSLVGFPSLIEAQISDPNWRIVSPATTGIPGSDTHFARVDGNDDLWVGGRYAFWSDGGIARFDGSTWDTFSNVDTPMPSQWINSVAFGASNVRWYGTGGGLVRHDGTDWQVFDSANSPLPTDDIINTVVDSSGAVWMKYFRSGGYLTKGVARFDGTTWQVWDRTELGFAVASDFTGPVIDAQGRVFVGSATGGTDESGMAIYDGTSWTLSNALTGTSNAPVSNLRTDPNGDVWCFWWMGIQKLVGTEWVSMPNPPTSSSIASFEPRTGTEYWVGTYNGDLLEYDGSQWIQHGPGAPTFPGWVLGIDWDSAGNQWICTLKAGVWFLDATTNVWTNYTSQNTGLPSYFIDDIETDANGGVWFANGGGGAAQFAGTPDKLNDGVWRCFNAANSGSEVWPWNFGNPWGNDSANDVLSDGLGGVWVSSSGVGHWDGSTWDQLYVSQNSNIWTNSGDARLELDTGGELWVAYDLYGLDRFDGTEWVHYSTSNGLPGNFIEEVISDGVGGVYIASNGGTAHFDGSSWTTLPTPPGYPFSSKSVAMGTDGHVWVGTSAGVARWDGTEWIELYSEADGLPADYVLDIEVAPNGDVWVGAFNFVLFPYYGGASRFDGSSWTLFNSSNSPLPHEQVERIHADAAGNVWFSAMSEGVAVLLNSASQTCQTDLGFGGPGDLALSICGEALSSGNTATFLLENATPKTPTFILVSDSNNPTSLFGGTLVPIPAALILSRKAKLDGTLSFPITGGNGPATAYVQCFALDSTQVGGVEISNALEFQLLP